MGERLPLWSMASMAAEGREPLRDWISLSLSLYLSLSLSLSLCVCVCFLLFLHSLILPFNRFLNSRRSVTPIGLKFGQDFYPDIGFLAAKEGHQPSYEVAMRAQGTP